VIKDAEGKVSELRCTYDSETRGGYAPDGRKVQGTLHWVSAPHALSAEVRLYDRLFAVPDPGNVGEGQTLLDNLNPNSRQVLTTCKVEPGLGSARPGDRFQFERMGYFCVDLDSTQDRLVFNRTATLRSDYQIPKF